ncbi:MAG TPA: hypothetical protein ENI74_03205 [Gammaproteobacteria bacterium]|nr:hypothetical protein [Gammaproteobacteria bacterium]
MTQKVQLQEAFKLALSLMLFYWLALTMDWDLPKFGALAIVVTSLSSSGASFNKGVMRVVGTGIGALAGFVLLSWFSQSPLGMMLAVAVYLVFVGYFLQTARQGDTWFNAGFLAVAVWSSSYMKVDTAFHFATSRFLETAAGVLLFTLVSALLWPRTSKVALQQQGQTLWEDMQKLYSLYRRQLIDGTVQAEAAGLRSKLVGDYQQMLATLEAAYSDTPQVRAKKHSWEVLRINLRAFGNAHELWRESISDCHKLDLHELLPGLEATLGVLDKRLKRGNELWKLQSSSADRQDNEDPSLLMETVLKIDKQAGTKLSHFERAALMNFVEQLWILDHTSYDLLRTLRILANLDPVTKRLERELPKDPYQPSAWHPERLLKATFPALCWVVAYTFWIYVDPPGGPAVAMIAAAFGLMMLMTPTNLFGLLIVLLLSMFITVAPVYMFIMPALDSGFGLLSLIFIYAFVFAWLGGISPVLKLGPLAMFVMMVDINNDQIYSFIFLVTAGLVMLLGVSIVVIVHRLLSPMHPEKIMLRSVRRFLTGCARITGTRKRKVKRRIFETTILPISAQLSGMERNLDYSQFPDNPPGKVHGLVDNLQSIRFRLQNLDATYGKAVSESPELMQTLAPLNEKWRQHVQNVFEQWARLEKTDTLIEEWNAQASLSQELEQHDVTDDRALQNLYAVVGSTQSLLEAMKELGDSIKQINWNQWAVARF